VIKLHQSEGFRNDLGRIPSRTRKINQKKEKDVPFFQNDSGFHCSFSEAGWLL
jgi:hypothetical protein